MTRKPKSSPAQSAEKRPSSVGISSTQTERSSSSPSSLSEGTSLDWNTDDVSGAVLIRPPATSPGASIDSGPSTARSSPPLVAPSSHYASTPNNEDHSPNKPTTVTIAATPSMTRSSSFLKRFIGLILKVMLVGLVLERYWYDVATSLARLSRLEGAYWYDSPRMGLSVMNATAYFAQNAPLQRVTFRKPELTRPGDVLIRVVKAGINPVDFKFHEDVQGFPLFTHPKIVGFDFSGIVEAVFPYPPGQSNRFAPGDRVFGMRPTSGGGSWGTVAEYIVLHEKYVAGMPLEMSFSEAAAAPLAALTATQAIALGMGKAMLPKARVLIHAGSGGVGTFAIQYAARVLGMEVITTTTNEALCRELGASRVVNHRLERFEEVIPPHSLDLIIDMMGGEYIARGMGLLKRGGSYIDVLNSGFVDSWKEFFASRGMPNVPSQVIHGLTGVSMGSRLAFYSLRYALGLGPFYHIAVVRSDGRALEEIAEMMRARRLVVVLDSEYVGFETGAKEALEKLKTGRTKGKVTVRVA